MTPETDARDIPGQTTNRLSSRQRASALLLAAGAVLAAVSTLSNEISSGQFDPILVIPGALLTLLFLFPLSITRHALSSVRSDSGGKAAGGSATDSAH